MVIWSQFIYMEQTCPEAQQAATISESPKSPTKQEPQPFSQSASLLPLTPPPSTSAILPAQRRLSQHSQTHLQSPTTPQGPSALRGSRGRNMHLGKEGTGGSRESEEGQWDSAQEEERQGHLETLEGIFAMAIAEGAVASIEPQEMEEHRLERFTSALHSSEDEQDDRLEAYEEEYIDDETLNVLCSPLIGSPASQHYCIPPPSAPDPDPDPEDLQQPRDEQEELFLYGLEDTPEQG